MITYEYLCEKCQHNFEAVQSIKDRPLDICPCCGECSIQRVIHIGVAFVKEGITDSTTLGKLAAVNTSKMGKYELEDKRLHQSEQKIKAKEALQQEMAEKVGSKPIDMRKKPWYSKLGADKINKMTPKQKIDYVQRGN